MSDNIAPDLIKKRLVTFLRIPNETWTEVLAMLPRRILVKSMSSACHRLKQISDKNVNNVHVTRNSMMFAINLKGNKPEAIQQLAHLAANKCPLAGQIRVTFFFVICEKSKEVLRHCSDLLRGYRMSLTSYSWHGEESYALTEQSLSILEANNNKPSQIYVRIYERKLDQFNNFWQHPTFLHCSRIEFEMRQKELSRAYANVFFQWLHQLPVPMEGDGDEAEEQRRPIRCLIIQTDYDERIRAIKWLLAQCIQNFQQSQLATDRRRFVLCISNLMADEIAELGQFGRHENHKTGEVLLLEPENAQKYRYRRCLAEEVANGEEFYAKTFYRNDPILDKFAISDAPLVEIQYG